jgi:hypothetical protein
MLPIISATSEFVPVLAGTLVFVRPDPTGTPTVSRGSVGIENP